MTTTSILDQPAVRNRILPLSTAQYQRLGEWGILQHDTELLNGLVVKKMPKSPLHEYVVSILYGLFTEILSNGYWVRKEAPLTLSDSEPEPDISIVRGKARDFKTAHPASAELVIEVALSSVELDKAKASIYAAAGIPEYWIVLPELYSVDVYRLPLPSGYAEITRYSRKDSIAAPENTRIDLQRLFA